MMGPLLLSVIVTVAVPPGSEAKGGDEHPAISEETQASEVALSDVLASCEKALGRGECTRAGGNENSWRASVVFLRDAAHVTLSRPNRVIVRSLEFLPEDSEKQRRVAAGLLVAAMTAAARLSEPEPAEPEPPEPKSEEAEPPDVGKPEPAARPTPPRREKAASSRKHVRRLELGAVAGPTLGATHWGGGGVVAASADLRPELGAGGGIEVLYSESDGLQVLKLGAGLGPRVDLLPGVRAVGWSLALEGVLDYTRINTASMQEGARSALRGGGRLRTGVSFGAGSVRPLFGLGITALSPGLEIRRDESLMVPAFLGSVFLGVVLNSMK